MLFFEDQEDFIVLLTGAKRREFSGMIPVITSNNHPSNPQQPIHSLRLAPVRICLVHHSEKIVWSWYPHFFGS